MSSPTPPTTPKGGSKWASRMGAAVRRSSTLLSISRPTTPAPDSDTASLRRSTSREAIPAAAPALSTTRLPAADPSTLPTPIAESPAREAAAMQQQETVVGPSPLAQAARAAEESAAAPAPAAAETPAAEDAATSPVGYVPPPVIDSTVGNPGAFTDGPEALPQPDVVRDPYAASNTGPPPAPVEEAAPPVAEPEPAAEPEAAAPAINEEYAPPAVLDSNAGNPGAYTDLATDLPQPPAAAAQDPFAGSAAPAEGASAIPRPEEPAALAHADSYFEDKAMAESMLEYDPAAPAPAPAEFAHAVEVHAPTPVAAQHDDDDVFGPILALGVANAPAEEEEEEGHKPEEPQQPVGAAAEYYGGAPPMPVAEPHPYPHAPHADAPQHQHADEPAPAESRAPTFSSGAAYDYLPEYMTPDIWGGAQHGQGQGAGEGGPQHNVWAAASAMPVPRAEEGREGGAMPIPIPVARGASVGNGNGHGNGSGVHSLAPSFKMPNPHPEVSYSEDPFADPVQPSIAVVQPAEPSGAEMAPQPQVMPVASHDDVTGIVTMPLPAFHDVVPQPIQAIPSQSSFGASMMPNAETNERIPLLARPGTPHKPASYVQTPTNGTNHATVSPLAPGRAGPSAAWNPHGVAAAQPRLHELGWLAYHLPDGGAYYVHPTRRVATDAALRTERVLVAVEAWLDARGDEVLDVGVEAWLREAKTPGGTGRGVWRGGKKALPPVELERFWVDHHARTVVRDDGEDRRVTGYTRGHIRGAGGHGKGKQVGGAGAALQNQEDQLDLEYRFWSFMEAHPAHQPLPHKAKAEAMDVLTWAWTDRLLPSARPIPPPFTQDECQELMNLLRSFSAEGHHDDHGIQTRVVARILLRVAQWRQMYFRPNKPLPKDVSVGPNEVPVQRRPVRRALFDFLVSCLCLGIPYIFLERARLSARGDPESGMYRQNSMVIIGACTCLVAAIVLSASVTFLSLPGLDSVARTAGMVAVVFATFSLVATGVAILRHKADLERPISHVGIEGLMVISRRTVALSLPMVFLAYALIGFLTGLILYTFRGAPLGNPGSKTSFEDYARWIIVGVVGALAGIVTTSLLVLP